MFWVFFIHICVIYYLQEKCDHPIRNFLHKTGKLIEDRGELRFVGSKDEAVKQFLERKALKHPSREKY